MRCETLCRSTSSASASLTVTTLISAPSGTFCPQIEEALARLERDGVPAHALGKLLQNIAERACPPRSSCREPSFMNELCHFESSSRE